MGHTCAVHLNDCKTLFSTLKSPFIDVLRRITPDPTIYFDFFANIASKELPNRYSQFLAFDIPQGNIQTRDRRLHRVSDREIKYNLINLSSICAPSRQVPLDKIWNDNHAAKCLGSYPLPNHKMFDGEHRRHLRRPPCGLRGCFLPSL